MIIFRRGFIKFIVALLIIYFLFIQIGRLRWALWAEFESNRFYSDNYAQPGIRVVRLDALTVSSRSTLSSKTSNTPTTQSSSTTRSTQRTDSTIELNTTKFSDQINITLNYRLTPEAESNDQPKKYQVFDLFASPISNGTVSFEELPKLPRLVLKSARYPRIFYVYPQDIPLRDTINRIKSGRPISYVSFCTKIYYGKYLKCSFLHFNEPLIKKDSS